MLRLNLPRILPNYFLLNNAISGLGTVQNEGGFQMHKKLFLIVVFVALFSIVILFDLSKGQWLQYDDQMKRNLDRNFLKGYFLLDNMSVVKPYQANCVTISPLKRMNPSRIDSQGTSSFIQTYLMWRKYQQLKNLSPNERKIIKRSYNYLPPRFHNIIGRPMLYLPKKS